ncbi:4Fe-4S binding protein [bacterium]|nr:4Fe-4S binding protein [bacterium]
MFDKLKTIKIISLGVLVPLLFYPLIYCPFKLPYLYCFICHIKCPWGKLRGLFLLGILGLNLKKRFYCSYLCPCGTIQDFQGKVKTKRLILPKWSHHIKYLILGLVIAVVLVNRRNPLFIIDGEVFLYFFALVFVISFFSHRFWCLIFCPLRALDDIILKIRKFLSRDYDKNV